MDSIAVTEGCNSNVITYITGVNPAMLHYGV